MPQSDPEEHLLISTQTYEGYFNAKNPFPMVDILPTVKSQHQLHTSYRVEENGGDIYYSLMYEYRADGLAGKRIASSSGGSETAVYHYY